MGEEKLGVLDRVLRLRTERLTGRLPCETVVLGLSERAALRVEANLPNNSPLIGKLFGMTIRWEDQGSHLSIE